MQGFTWAKASPPKIYTCSTEPQMLRLGGRLADGLQMSDIAIPMRDKFGLQVRIRGTAIRCTDSKNDAYFSSRDLGSQVAAWASDQSKEIESLEMMDVSYQKIMDKFNIGNLEDNSEKKIPRPNFWGGYEIWVEEIELWKNQKNRFHDRLKFTRNINIKNGNIEADKRWNVIRIQP